MQNPTPDFWKGKQVLLTGHTGFKGAWLAFWLSKMGAKVFGVSLPPNTAPNLFTLCKIEQRLCSLFFDIRNANLVSDLVKKIQPEVVFHLAAQALVRHGYRNPLDTFSTNVMGTVNILNAIRGINSVRVFIGVTTDKVYKNFEQQQAYLETDALGGYDPYSASKAASELVISAYRDSYLATQGVAIASARAGNVIGGGDWSEERLIPDAIRAWDSNMPLQIRRPNAVRPWQHVLEPLSGYLILAEKIYKDVSLSGAYNFGPRIDEIVPVREVVEIARKAYGAGEILWGDAENGPHEANLLTLNPSKAANLLGVVPRWTAEQSIISTIDWYQSQRRGEVAESLCEKDISRFIVGS